MARMKGDDQGTESGIRMRMPGVVDSALVQFSPLVLFPDLFRGNQLVLQSGGCPRGF